MGAHNVVSQAAHRVEEFCEVHYTFFIWWVAVRYFSVGLEYLTGLFPKPVAPISLDPTVIGVWLVLLGLLGFAARLACWHGWNTCANRLMHVFGVAVIAHALFRVGLMAQGKDVNTFIALLVAVDGASMIAMIRQLHKWKS